MQILLLLLLQTVLPLGATAPTAAGDTVPVTIVLTNLPSTTSTISINFYNSAETFLKSGQEVLHKKVVPRNQSQVQMQVDLPPGEWAVALSQDMNDNGKMDYNLLGIPTEPYAFSNNVRPRFKAPDFEECKFMAKGEGHTLTIRLEK